MAFKANIIFHLERIQKALPLFSAEATMDVRDFSLEIRGRNRYYKLIPQLLGVRNGKIRYTAAIEDGLRGFHGWTSYYLKHWAIAVDKLAFKRFCQQNKLLAPEYSLVTPEDLGGYLIKPQRSSFAYGIKGPFRSDASLSSRHKLKEGEYFDQYIEGDIIKAWYWNDRLTCLEVRKMPTVTGDGKNTLRDLIVKLYYSKVSSFDWNEIDDIAHYQGFSLDTVIPDQQSIVVDYRYGTLFIPLSVENSNVLSQHQNTPLVQQLEAAGPLFWKAIPEDIRKNSMHAVDAILDRDNKVWFLESNCNSMVHPDVYVHMLESLFGPPKETSSDAGAIQSLPPATPIPAAHQVSAPARPQNITPQSPETLSAGSILPMRLTA